MGIRSCKISTTKDKSASRSGLVALAEPVRKLGLDTHFERLMPEPGSNRGLRPGAYLTTFMLMMHEGSRHPGAVAQLREEMPLLELLGIRRLPGDDALSRWPRRCEKSSAEFTYKKERGCMPIVGHIAETGMAAGAEFRGGPVSPNARNCEFVRQCERALPRGAEARRARIDAAGYQARIINRFTSRGIGYAIRARLDQSVAEQTRGAGDQLSAGGATRGRSADAAAGATTPKTASASFAAASARRICRAATSLPMRCIPRCACSRSTCSR